MNTKLAAFVAVLAPSVAFVAVSIPSVAASVPSVATSVPSVAASVPSVAASAPAVDSERGGDKTEISAVLDDFHAAASHADFARYFGHFTDDAVFLGTDASERWTREEFENYAGRRFASGDGWTYHATSRHVTVGAGGTTAWFDELLHNDSYGQTRGTGVLVKQEGRWKVAQYHLTIPIPNELATEVVEMIRQRQR